MRSGNGGISGKDHDDVPQGNNNRISYSNILRHTCDLIGYSQVFKREPQCDWLQSHFEQEQ